MTYLYKAVVFYVEHESLMEKKIKKMLPSWILRILFLKCVVHIFIKKIFPPLMEFEGRVYRCHHVVGWPVCFIKDTITCFKTIKILYFISLKIL